MTSLKTIRLYGKLGTKFGRLHRLAVNSAAEAVRALCALRPGFERELMTSRDRGIGYAVFLGKKNLKEEQLTEEAEEREIRIAPVLQGAGFGSIFKIILGVVLVVVSYFIPASWGVWGEVLAVAAQGAGMSLAMTGITEMLTPKGLSARDGPKNGASYTFNGPVNTTAQGNPVPVGYGRMIIGSAVISARIYSADRL